MDAGSNDKEKYIYFIKAENIFRKPIPFKIYSLAGEQVKGTKEHTHDYMQIWYVMGGCCEHWVNDRSYRLTRGNLFVLPPFVTHRIQHIEGEDIKVIGCEFLASFISDNVCDESQRGSLFDFAYLEPFLVSTENVRPRLHLTGMLQDKAESLLQDMLKEFEQEERYYQLTIKADLLRLLAIIAREYEKQGSSQSNELFNRYRDAVNEAILYINRNFTSRIYIEDVCRIAMMSQTYFSHLFKQIIGKSFVEYINSLRIRKATDMLVSGSLPVSEICFEVGFNDITYFNKVFKRETGLSPRQYRKLSYNRT